jgi:hypothetical protein
MAASAQQQAVLEVPATAIRVPAAVSPQAQAYLARGPLQTPPRPALDDTKGWKTMIAATDEMVLGRLEEAGMTDDTDFDVEEISVGGATAFAVSPEDLDPSDTRVYLSQLDDRPAAGIVAG